MAYPPNSPADEADSSAGPPAPPAPAAPAAGPLSASHEAAATRRHVPPGPLSASDEAAATRRHVPWTTLSVPWRPRNQPQRGPQTYQRPQLLPASSDALDNTQPWRNSQQQALPACSPRQTTAAQRGATITPQHNTTVRLWQNKAQYAYQYANTHQNTTAHSNHATLRRHQYTQQTLPAQDAAEHQAIPNSLHTARKPPADTKMAKEWLATIEAELEAVTFQVNKLLKWACHRLHTDPQPTAIQIGRTTAFAPGQTSQSHRLATHNASVRRGDRTFPHLRPTSDRQYRGRAQYRIVLATPTSQ